MSAQRAGVVGDARGIEPFCDAPGSYGVITGQADLKLHDAGFGANGLAGCEADDAGLVAACGLDAVLGSEQLADERLGHCGRLQGFPLVGERS